jgi:hypothetical protein
MGPTLSESGASGKAGAVQLDAVVGPYSVSKDLQTFHIGEVECKAREQDFTIVNPFFVRRSRYFVDQCAHAEVADGGQIVYLAVGAPNETCGLE